ncbi:hypothetical protein IC617_05945 [Neiella sp. HB171785]|uniref:Entry exclusion lipoprotein TrbK n=1 Tax=Neiella litorisoli TaxID=2771431 RepID=A0A8J6ULH1_9GAMM|nr:hypothetical protein [Neiella litorisoli]MBD1388965.1 hypothetical protein [Neiella litorisoli]
MKLTLLFATTLLSTAVLAEGPAPKDIYQETVELCNEWADDDEIPAGERQEYLNKCIKNDLENMGYTADKPAGGENLDAIALNKDGE